MEMPQQTPEWDKLPGRTLETELDFQENDGRLRTVIFTDVDDTFYRANDAEAIRGAYSLQRRARAVHVPLVIATGNSFQTMAEKIETGVLPPFESIIGSVGTEIWDRTPEGSYTFDADYDAMLRATGYDKETIISQATALLANFTPFDMQLQPNTATADSAYKVSLNFFASDQQEVADIEQSWLVHFPNFKVVVCEEIGHNKKLAEGEGPKKYCLDVVAATKADAINYLETKYRVQTGLVAGDSGNDIQAMTETSSNFAAILVGGHKPEALAALEQQLVEDDDESFFRQTALGKTVFIERHKTRMAANSILYAAEQLELLPASV